jgi:hypothetical protein
MRRQRQPRRHARSHLQTQYRQKNPTSLTQLLRLAGTRPTRSQGTCRTREIRREASGRSHADSVALRTLDVAAVTGTLAESYMSKASSHAGNVAEGAANRKELKYQSLATTHTFIPLAFETLGPINSKGVAFFNQLGGRLADCSGDKRETYFLLQPLSLTVQRFNVICFQGSFHSNLADFDS